jgi:hypothetical protein
MTTSTLYRAVAAFADATIGLTDTDLERDYAWRFHDDEGLRFALIGTYHELRDLATTLAAERVTTSPPTLAQRALAQYHLAFRDLQAALLGVDHATAQREPAAEEWPLWFTMVHMIKTEQQFFPRIAHAVEQQRAGAAQTEMAEDERLAFLARDPATDSLRLLEFVFGDAVGSWAEVESLPLPDEMHGRFSDLLAYFGAHHDRVLHELSPLDDADLAAISPWWEATWMNAEVPVRFRLHRFDAHLRQHTIQVDKTLAQLDQAPSEAKRLLRLIYAALAEAEGTIIGASDVGAEACAALAATIADRADDMVRLVAG